MTRGCGNDPRTVLTVGDAKAVAEFRAYLRARKTVADYEAPQPETQAEAAVSPTALLLASRCDACCHTLNRHHHYGSCNVVLCVCSRFQPPTDDDPAVVADR